MNKAVKLWLEWGSKILSLIILFQQTILYSNSNSFGTASTLTYTCISAGILAIIVILLVVIGFWQKEKRLYVTSLFPLIAFVLVGISLMLQ